jgi:hypothetical protein
MACRFCPIHQEFGVAYHWRVDQCEYATDLVFRRQVDLAAIYGHLTPDRDSHCQARQHRHLPGPQR